MKAFDQAMAAINAAASEAYRQKLTRFGIDIRGAVGAPIPALRGIAKSLGMNHQLALALWETHVQEAMILASYIADPLEVDEVLADRMAGDFDSWGVCDQCCALFERTPFAYRKALAWSEAEPEFVKRSGFVVMAGLAVHDKTAADEKLGQFFPALVREAHDNRNFVKKAVNWALRQLGKRNLALNREAIQVAERIKAQGSPSARWIASDALRELRSDKVQAWLA